MVRLSIKSRSSDGIHPIKRRRTFWNDFHMIDCRQRQVANVRIGFVRPLGGASLRPLTSTMVPSSGTGLRRRSVQGLPARLAGIHQVREKSAHAAHRPALTVHREGTDAPFCASAFPAGLKTARPFGSVISAWVVERLR